MKINTELTLTRDEVKDALTAWVRNLVAYRHDFPYKYGDVLDFVEVSDGSEGWSLSVTWGKKPEPVMATEEITETTSKKSK